MEPESDLGMALIGTMEPVRMSIQYGSHPGGSLHSDGTIICAWAGEGARRRKMVKITKERSDFTRQNARIMV